MKIDAAKLDKIVGVVEVIAGQVGGGVLRRIPVSELVGIIRAVIAALPDGITEAEAGEIGRAVGVAAYKIIAD